MNNRFKEIREKLNLSQEEFGNAIGIKRSGISNIESGLRAVSERHIKLLHSAYNVNEHWLRTGEGEMFNPINASLDAMAEAHQIDGLTRIVIESLIEMPDTQREAFINLVHNVAERIRCADYEGAQAMAVDAAIRYGSALSASKVQNPPEEDQAQASETHTV